MEVICLLHRLFNLPSLSPIVCCYCFISSHCSSVVARREWSVTAVVSRTKTHQSREGKPADLFSSSWRYFNQAQCLHENGNACSPFPPPIVGGISWCFFLNWCFEPSQPLRNISGLFHDAVWNGLLLYWWSKREKIRGWAFDSESVMLCVCVCVCVCKWE